MNTEKVEVALKGQDGKVIILFSRDINYFEMPPGDAINFSEMLCQCAFECRDGVKPIGDALKAELVEKHRMKLTQRVALMMNSIREDKTKSNGMVAKAVIDACLAEIF